MSSFADQPFDEREQVCHQLLPDAARALFPMRIGSRSRKLTRPSLTALFSGGNHQRLANPSLGTCLNHQAGGLSAEVDRDCLAKWCVSSSSGALGSSDIRIGQPVKIRRWDVCHRVCHDE